MTKTNRVTRATGAERLLRKQLERIEASVEALKDEAAVIRRALRQFERASEEKMPNDMESSSALPLTDEALVAAIAAAEVSVDSNDQGAVVAATKETLKRQGFSIRGWHKRLDRVLTARGRGEGPHGRHQRVEVQPDPAR